MDKEQPSPLPTGLTILVGNRLVTYSLFHTIRDTGVCKVLDQQRSAQFHVLVMGRGIRKASQRR